MEFQIQELWFCCSAAKSNGICLELTERDITEKAEARERKESIRYQYFSYVGYFQNFISAQSFIFFLILQFFSMASHVLPVTSNLLSPPKH